MRQPARLVCHPGTPDLAVQRIETHAQIQAGTLVLHYSLAGDLASLRIPPPRPPQRADRLWEHGCFEAFVAVDGTPGYLEFNFAPSGEWAIYSFSRYREAAALPDNLPAPTINVRATQDRLELEAVIALAGWVSPGARLRLGLSAVIENQSGALSYWALRHPAGKPDFHHPEAFALELGLDA